MEPSKILNMSAKTFQKLMTILIFWLIIVVAIQLVCAFASMLIYKTFYYEKNLSSEICFLPNGDVHRLDIKCEYRAYYRPECLNYEVKIFNSTDKLVWKGILGDIPYEYLNFGTKWYLHNSSRICFGTDYDSRVEKAFYINMKGMRWEYDKDKNIIKRIVNNTDPNLFVGSDGFSDAGKMPLPFEKPIGFIMNYKNVNIVYWFTERKLYRIDFINKKVDTLLDVGPSEICESFYSSYVDDFECFSVGQPVEHRPLIGLRTKSNKMYLWLKDSEQKVILEPSSIYQGSYAVAAKDNIYIIFHHPASKDNKNNISQLYKIDNSGKPLLISSLEWQARVLAYHSPEEIRNQYLYYASQSYPIAGEVMPQDTMKNFCNERDCIKPFFKEIILTAREGDLSKKLIVTAVFILLALWHGWARRTTWAKFSFWLVFIGLFNLAGFLTYLALNHTAVIKCPACGKKRNLERSDCVRCGDNLPKISPKPLILSQK